jgi:type II secretory ATPase GspE/PulE/Tfp pilus assembly ATPase PilB-like protein
VSIVPTVCGENVVLRLLSGVLAASDFGALGMPPDVGAALTAALDESQGMILATGPTGSGKTTTLYTAMKRVSTPEVHCVAIEDPVEIRLALVRHVQVNTEIGLTFAGALRSIMRQDPDVILVGEVRDEETARIAVQAAQTGHMVLSTLHTNDAPGAVARLRDLGCAGFAVSAAVLAVVGQRLIRRVCVDCAAPYQPEAALLRRFGGVDAGQARRGKGCAKCAHTGFAGRVGVYELMRVSPAVRAGIEEAASTEAIRKVALADGMRPMWRDGLEKARLGMTTIEEVGRLAAASLDGDLAAGRRAAA